MADKVKIGTITLLVTKRFTNSYECAAWHQTVECAPQTVGLYLHPGYDDASYAPLTFRFRGEVVSSDFTSYFCGNRIGAGKVDEDKGRIAECGEQHDSVHLLDLMLGNRGEYAIVLADGVTLDVRPIQYGAAERSMLHDGAVLFAPRTGAYCKVRIAR